MYFFSFLLQIMNFTFIDPFTMVNNCCGYSYLTFLVIFVASKSFACFWLCVLTFNLKSFYLKEVHFLAFLFSVIGKAILNVFPLKVRWIFRHMEEFHWYCHWTRPDYCSMAWKVSFWPLQTLTNSTNEAWMNFLKNWNKCLYKRCQMFRKLWQMKVDENCEILNITYLEDTRNLWNFLAFTSESNFT